MLCRQQSLFCTFCQAILGPTIRWAGRP